MSLFFTLPLCAQIQLGETEKAKKNSEYNKESSFIRFEDGGYYFRAWDYECSKAHLSGESFIVKLFLGTNYEEVQQSGVLLNNWFSNATNDNFTYVTNPNGNKVCIYKYNSNIYFSYGTEVNCKATRLQYGADLAVALTGGRPSTKTSTDVLMRNVEFGEHVLTGMCSFKKDFMKSIKNFKE